jgi:coproporphyrinogen III oxidase-like Fe-S oxidoreductase
MQVEEGTPFDRWNDAGKLELPGEDDSVAMLAAASRTLRGGGYEHYELSNYARRGHRCRHNMVYWLGHSYYAFGVGAASFLQGRRFSRPKKLRAWEAYVDSIRDVSRSGSLPGPGAAHFVAGESEAPLGAQGRMLEGLMLQLRLADGVDLHRFAADFGADKCERLLDAVQPHAAAGLALVEWVSSPGGQGHEEAAAMPWEGAQAALALDAEDAYMRLRLSDPYGLMVSNNILSDVFAALTDG